MSAVSSFSSFRNCLCATGWVDVEGYYIMTQVWSLASPSHPHASHKLTVHVDASKQTQSKQYMSKFWTVPFIYLPCLMPAYWQFSYHKSWTNKLKAKYMSTFSTKIYRNVFFVLFMDFPKTFEIRQAFRMKAFSCLICMQIHMLA